MVGKSEADLTKPLEKGNGNASGELPVQIRISRHEGTSSLICFITRTGFTLPSGNALKTKQVRASPCPAAQISQNHAR